MEAVVVRGATYAKSRANIAGRTDQNEAVAPVAAKRTTAAAAQALLRRRGRDRTKALRGPVGLPTSDGAAPSATELMRATRA